MTQLHDHTQRPAALAALLDDACQAHADRIAVVDGPSGASVTYRELGDRVEAIAGWLSGQGVGRGSVVATWAPNLPPVAAFTVAALKLGAAVTGINPVATDPEVARQVRDAAVTAVLTVPRFVDRTQALDVQDILVVGEASSGTPLNDVLAAAGTAPAVSLAPDDLALLPYSSGTTGVPKGVMLHHGNLTAVVGQLKERIQVDEHDVTLAVAPFFHILGVTATMLLPLAAGATVVTLPQFEPTAFLELVQRHRVTYLAVPPPVAAFLATHPAVDGYDLSSLELLASGGAPLPVAVQERLTARFPDCAIGQGWGLTETSGAVCVPHRRGGAEAGTVGHPVADTEVRAVDPDSGATLEPGAVGELEVRGPQVMLGYLHRPDDTEAVLGPDGWLRTGDLGYVNERGAVVIVDRLKDLIKVKGLQVSPTEVEQALLDHPAVTDAVVTRRPDARSGEVPVAHVVLGAEVTPDALIGWLSGRLSPYKLPAEVVVRESVPRTPSGKVLRRILEQSWSRRG